MFRNLSTNGLGTAGRPSELIELALSFGFKSIDLDIEDFESQVSTHGLAHARRLVDSARLKYALFRLPVVWDGEEQLYQQGMTRLPKLAELAAQVGCTRCITTMAPASDSRPYHENFEFHRKRLAEIAGGLAPAGVRLGIEFVASPSARANRSFEFIHSLEAVILLTGMIRATNIGVVLDLWQMHAAGNSLDDTRKLSAQQIVAVNVSDVVAQENGEAGLEEQTRSLPGETGVIDSAAALAKLAELGYDGPVTPMVHKDRTGGMRRDALVKLAGQRLDQIWKAAGLSAAGKLTPAGNK